jgi:hypothetical protein
MSNEDAKAHDANRVGKQASRLQFHDLGGDVFEDQNGDKQNKRIRDIEQLKALQTKIDVNIDVDRSVKHVKATLLKFGKA